MYDYEESFNEKMNSLKESIDVMISFQLYRKGYIETNKNEPKEIGEAINVLIATALEFVDIMEENKVLKNMYHEVKEKLHELENKTNNTNNSNRARKNGENDTQCLDCKDYDKQQGMCRWGECMWYTRKPMCFDMRYCCKTCAFDIDGRCNYLKEQDKREKERKENKNVTLIEDYMKGKRNETSN